MNWHLCPVCAESLIDHDGVCLLCISSHPKDWVLLKDYFEMVRLAYAAGQRPQHLYNEAQMVLEGFPSFQPSERALRGLGTLDRLTAARDELTKGMRRTQ